MRKSPPAGLDRREGVVQVDDLDEIKRSVSFTQRGRRWSRR